MPEPEYEERWWLIAGEGDKAIFEKTHVVFHDATDPMTGEKVMSRIIGSLDGEDLGRDFVVHTFYCNGSIKTEYCGEAGLAVKLYTQKLTAGIRSTNQQGSPIREPFHVAMVSLYMRIRDEDTEKTAESSVYSPFFPCAHGGVMKDLDNYVQLWSNG